MQLSLLFRKFIAEGLYVQIIVFKYFYNRENSVFCDESVKKKKTIFRSLTLPTPLVKPYGIYQNNVLRNCISLKSLQKSPP